MVLRYLYRTCNEAVTNNLTEPILNKENKIFCIDLTILATIWILLNCYSYCNCVFIRGWIFVINLPLTHTVEKVSDLHPSIYEAYCSLIYLHLFFFFFCILKRLQRTDLSESLRIICLTESKFICLEFWTIKVQLKPGVAGLKLNRESVNAIRGKQLTSILGIHHISGMEMTQSIYSVKLMYKTWYLL